MLPSSARRRRSSLTLGLVLLGSVPIIACEERTAPWCDARGSLVGEGALRPPGDSAVWPGEPSGLTVVSDGSFMGLNKNADGWRGQQRERTNGSRLSLAVDPTAPLSPSGVLAFAYGVGFPGGSSPGAAAYHLATATKETYFGFWWKPSSSWQNHAPSGVNKIALLFPITSGAGSVYIMMFFDETTTTYTIQVEPTFPRDTRRLAPNVTATPVALGEWHQIGWYVKYSTTATSRDGVAQWWLDGALQGVYTDLQMPGDAGLVEYTIAPVWGGVGDAKTEADCFWYDHAHISVR